MTARLVLLLRHGESEWNRTGRWQGRSDPPLTAAGIAAAEAAGRRLPRVFTRVVASPLRRAAHTAQALCAGLGLGLGAVDLDARLMERGLGAWEGLSSPDAQATFPDEWAQLTRQGQEPAAWESRSSTIARVHEALADTTDGPVLMVTHGGPIRCLEQHHGVFESPLSNLEGVWVIVDDGAPALLGRERWDEDASEPSAVL